MELPINAVVFQSLGDNLPATVALAAVVGAVLLACAHLFGEQVRQTQRWTWQEIARAVVCGLAPLGLIGAVGYFRHLYAGSQANTLRVLGYTMDPEAVTLAFAAVNIGIFVVGAIFSYRIHPKGLGEVRRTGRRSARARAAVARAERVLENARTQRVKAFELAQARVDWLQEAVDLLAERYRQVNLLRRTDRQDHDTPYPASFQTPLPIGRPAGLLTLDWSRQVRDAETTAQAEDRGTPGPFSGDGAEEAPVLHTKL